MFAFFRSHPKTRYFTIAGLIIAGFFLFWILVLNVPVWCGWIAPYA